MIALLVICVIIAFPSPAFAQAVPEITAEAAVMLDMDTGEIIMQAHVPVLPDDTAQTLHARIQVQEHILYPAAILSAVARL